jgi:hypothetical protein
VQNVSMSGACSDAVLVLDGLMLCQFIRINIGGGSATVRCPAGVKWTNAAQLSTTTHFYDIHVTGTSGAAGGLTNGVVIGSDCVINASFEKPVIESIAESAFVVDKGNFVTINDLYTEAVPNTNVVNPICSIGKTTPAAAYPSVTHIRGGIMAGPVSGSYTNVFAFDVDNVAILDLDGIRFERVAKFMDSAATAHQKISVERCDDFGQFTAFGTVGWPEGFHFGDTNKFAVAPASSMHSGVWTAKPTHYLVPGQVYFATDANTNGSPRWWNGTAWVDSAGTVVT